MYLAGLVVSGIGVAQQAPGLNDVLRQARQEIADFKKGGGENNDPRHPAAKWAQELWKWRDTSSGTPDAAKATTEAVRFLVYADRVSEVQRRVDLIPADDPAWSGLSRVLLDSAARQKDYTYFFAKLQSVLSGAKDATTRAAVHLNLGRAWRQQHDEKQAEAEFRLAMEAPGNLPASKDAERQLYEMLHLGVGKPAPAFAADQIGGGRISPAEYRGKPLLLVFWATH